VPLGPAGDTALITGGPSGAPAGRTVPCTNLPYFGATVAYAEGQNPTWQPIAGPVSIPYGWTSCGGQLRMSSSTGGSGTSDWSIRIEFTDAYGAVVNTVPDVPLPGNATTAWSTPPPTWSQAQLNAVRGIKFSGAANGFGTRSAHIELNIITYGGSCLESTDCCAELEAKLDKVLAAVTTKFKVPA